GGDGVSVFDPAIGTFHLVPNNLTDLKCAGISLLPDGRVLATGGFGPSMFIGNPDTNIFDPVNQTRTRTTPMAFNRWYPTQRELPNGKILNVSGANGSMSDTGLVLIPEIFDPSNNSWTTVPQASALIKWYPFMFVLPDGRLLQAGSNGSPTN